MLAYEVDTMEEVLEIQMQESQKLAWIRARDQKDRRRHGAVHQRGLAGEMTAMKTLTARQSGQHDHVACDSCWRISFAGRWVVAASDAQEEAET